MKTKTAIYILMLFSFFSCNEKEQYQAIQKSNKSDSYTTINNENLKVVYTVKKKRGSSGCGTFK